MHTSIRHMNYSMDLRQRLLEAQLQGARVMQNTAQGTQPTTTDPIEALKAKIHKERLFIAKYKSNYRRLADEAYGRIKWYRRKIKEIKEGMETDA